MTNFVIYTKAEINSSGLTGYNVRKNKAKSVSQKL